MKNQIKTIFLMGILSAGLIAFGGLLGSGYFYGFALIALVMNLGTYFFSDKIVLAMHRAKEISPAEAPRLHQIITELTQKAKIPKPRLFLIPEAQPNAFATGRNPQHAVVAVTEGIMNLLDERELRGVLAHELAHIKNRDILIASIAAAIASLITYLAHALGFMNFFGGHQDEEQEGSAAGGILFAIVAPLAATLVQLGISRAREYHADQTGALICEDPQALADALIKLEQSAHLVPADTQPATASLFIVNPFSRTQALLKLFSTHPPVKDRVERLQALALNFKGKDRSMTPLFQSGNPYAT